MDEEEKKRRHRARIDKRRADFPEAFKAIRRKSWYKVTYNMTVEQFDALAEAQDHKCAICNQPCGTGKRLSIDHDHACCPGQTSCGNCIRGLICWSCNTGLGKFKDSEGLLMSAVIYLQEYKKLLVGVGCDNAEKDTT